MDTTTIAIIAVAVVFVISIIWNSMQKSKKSKNTVITKQEEPSENPDLKDNEKFPYVLNSALLTNKEAKFYKSLKPIADKLNLSIFSKIRIADIVSAPKDTQNYIKWFNYIKSKHVDFVLFDDKFKPLLVIEVDDLTHDTAKGIKRDEFVDKVFNQVGLKILHIRLWKDEELTKQVVQALGIAEPEKVI